MYNTGNSDFISAACSSDRTIDTYAVLNMQESNVTVGVKDIASYKTTSSSTGGKSFVPGSFVAGQLELSLIGVSSVMTTVDFKQAHVDSILLHSGIKVRADMVYVPMGKFYPKKNGVVVSDDGYVKITASNIPEALEGKFISSTLTFPCTVGDALSHVASQTGLVLEINPDDFPNLSVELTESFVLTTTYREAIMYMVEILGGYAYMGRNGQICVKRCFSGLVGIGCTLDEKRIFSVSKQESSVKPFQYIGIKANADDLGVTTEVEGVSTECVYNIIDNPLSYGHPEDFLEGLVAPTSFTEFYPSKISFQGRPDLDVGDVLEYSYKGVTYLLPTCIHIFEYNGGFKTTLESIGSDVLNTSSVDSGTKTQIIALKQNINSLVRDLSKTQSDIVDINGNVSNLSSILQTATALVSRIESLEGSVGKYSTVSQEVDKYSIRFGNIEKDLKDVRDMVNEDKDALLSYFDFLPDGLVIGVPASDIKLKLSHNRINFLRNDFEEVAYFSEGKLYVSDAQFLKTLVLGDFEFVPRSNGNLSLRRRG